MADLWRTLRAFWSGTDAIRGYEATIERLERALGNWMTRAKAAEELTDRLRDRNQSLCRMLCARDEILTDEQRASLEVDARITNASPEKIQSIYRDIFAPVRHSPLDSWMHVEAETDEAAADLLAAKLGGKS